MKYYIDIKLIRMLNTFEEISIIHFSHCSLKKKLFKYSVSGDSCCAR